MATAGARIESRAASARALNAFRSRSLNRTASVRWWPDSFRWSRALFSIISACWQAAHRLLYPVAKAAGGLRRKGPQQEQGDRR